MSSFFGPQEWWPGETVDEIIIGAILTQNTNWNNVVKSIEMLRNNEMLSLKSIYKASLNEISSSIVSSGFFNQKAEYLKETAAFFEQFQFNYSIVTDIPELRYKLLRIKGIGRETADSIMLYAFKEPVFVIDSYTVRIFSRHFDLFPELYDEQQYVFHSLLDRDEMLFNEYHALIVKCGKEYCRKNNPRCSACPLVHI